MDGDFYPCTYDCPPEEGGDQVLAMLRGARDRVARKHTAYHYIGRGGAVCALGGIFAEDGISCRRLEWTRGVLAPRSGARLMARLEDHLSDAAKEAIRLLDRVAVQLYPGSANYGRLAGPVEAVNQRGNQAAVLKVYDRAITMRRQHLVRQQQLAPRLDGTVARYKQEA